jgi:hypothetical protein
MRAFADMKHTAIYEALVTKEQETSGELERFRRQPPELNACRGWRWSAYAYASYRAVPPHWCRQVRGLWEGGRSNLLRSSSSFLRQNPTARHLKKPPVHRPPPPPPPAAAGLNHAPLQTKRIHVRTARMAAAPRTKVDAAALPAPSPDDIQRSIASLNLK